ncbi:hypothetical protein [Actinoplanes sp. DH11]|uniref:hypothetical protein n=1 Tax=Actinoplanes sp. DH11 TaxID=2857011 RepID=UPI001E2CDF2D|nr:hypothetical protein [Actinoplanes sp. DH11]
MTGTLTDRHNALSAIAVSTPPRLPTPADRIVGRLLRIPAGACRYRGPGLLLLVRRVRLDISDWYGGQWVWLEGEELAATGQRLRWTQALVHVTACVPDRLVPTQRDGHGR